MNGQSQGDCKKMSIKCLVPVLAVFATLFGFQWLFHGVYMMPQYEATSSLWRSQEAMQKLWPICLITKFIMAFAITCLYYWIAKKADCGGKCVKTGAKFGFKIGLLLGAHDFASYMWLPIPMNMAVSWFIGDVIMGIVIGIVLAYVCRMCNKGECIAA